MAVRLLSKRLDEEIFARSCFPAPRPRSIAWMHATEMGIAHGLYRTRILSAKCAPPIQCRCNYTEAQTLKIHDGWQGSTMRTLPW